MQNSMKYLATSTMQLRSSMTIRPPEPMIEPMLREAFVIDRDVQMFGGDTAAARAAGLRRLVGVAVGDAAADVKDDLAQRDAHRHFDQAGRLDGPGQGKDFGPLAFFRADTGKPLGAVVR